MTLLPGPYDGLIHQVANQFQLPIDLLAAQVQVESAGDPWAFRYERGFFQTYLKGKQTLGSLYGPLAACSYGLLQIVLEVALELGFVGDPQDLFIPEVGLRWGATKMVKLWEWAGGDDHHYAQALAAYNGGTVGNTVSPFRNASYVQQVYKVSGRTI